MSNIRQLSLELAEAGMQIAAELKDPNGNVLLPSGATLTAASIKSLLRRGVTEISVVGADEPAVDPRIEQERQEQVRNRLAKLFRKSHPGELDRLLMDYVSIYRVCKKYE